MAGLVYAGAKPEESATTCADIDETDGGTALILKSDITGAAPNATSGLV
jgi:hypothetical protein